MNCTGWAGKELLALRRILDGVEQGVARTDLWKLWTEGDLHIDDRHAALSGLGQNAGGAWQHVLIFNVSGNDASLVVHAQYGRVPGIKRELSSFIQCSRSGMPVN